MPGALFGAAAREDLLRELELACRAAAMRGALAGGLGRCAALLLNTEPDLLDAPVSVADVPVVERAERELTLVAEITERRIADRPAELLHAVTEMRCAAGASRSTTSAPIGAPSPSCPSCGRTS